MAGFRKKGGRKDGGGSAITAAPSLLASAAVAPESAADGSLDSRDIWLHGVTVISAAPPEPAPVADDSRRRLPQVDGWCVGPAAPSAEPVRSFSPPTPTPAQDLHQLCCYWCPDLPKVTLRDPHPPEAALERREPDQSTVVLLSRRPDLTKPTTPATSPFRSAGEAEGQARLADSDSDGDGCFGGFQTTDILEHVHGTCRLRSCQSGAGEKDDPGDATPTRRRRRRDRRPLQYRPYNFRPQNPAGRKPYLPARRRARKALPAQETSTAPDANSADGDNFEPTVEVHSLPLVYWVVDQAEALALLHGPPHPPLSGDQCEALALGRAPLLVHPTRSAEAGWSVLDYLREAAQEQLDVLGYPAAPPPPPLLLPFPGQQREQTCRRRRGARPPARLPDLMTPDEWLAWRALMPPRRGRPRKYPRQDDLEWILLAIEAGVSADPCLHAPGPTVGPAAAAAAAAGGGHSRSAWSHRSAGGGCGQRRRRSPMLVLTRGSWLNRSTARRPHGRRAPSALPHGWGAAGRRGRRRATRNPRLPGDSRSLPSIA